MHKLWSWQVYVGLVRAPSIPGVHAFGDRPAFGRALFRHRSPWYFGGMESWTIATSGQVASSAAAALVAVGFLVAGLAKWLSRPQCNSCRRRGGVRWLHQRVDGGPDRRYRDNERFCSHCNARQTILRTPRETHAQHLRQVSGSNNDRRALQQFIDAITERFDAAISSCSLSALASVMRDLPTAGERRWYAVRVYEERAARIRHLLVGANGATAKLGLEILQLRYGDAHPVSRREVETVLDAAIAEAQERHATERSRTSREDRGSTKQETKEPRSGVDPLDPFVVLGIEPTATRADINRAFREKIAQYHPDKVASMGKELQDFASELTKRVNAARAECLRRVSE